MDKLKGLRIATRYASIDELVEKMHRFCAGSSIFVATRELREVGVEGPFALQLADRTAALRGWCVVLDAWATGDNPYRQPGMRLGLDRLTPESRDVFAQMQVRRAFEAEPPRDLVAAERRRRQSTLRTPEVQLRLPGAAGARSASPRPGEPTQPMPLARAVPRRAPEAPRRAPGLGTAAERAMPQLRPMPPLPGAGAPQETRPLPAGRALELAGLRPRRPSAQVVLPANPLRDLSDATVGDLVGGLGDGSHSGRFDVPDAVWDVRGTGRDEPADDDSFAENDDSAFEVLDAYDAPSIRRREPSWAPPTAVGTPTAGLRARRAEAAVVVASVPAATTADTAAPSAPPVEAAVAASAAAGADAEDGAAAGTDAEAGADAAASTDAAVGTAAAPPEADGDATPAGRAAPPIRWHVVLATVISCLGIAAAIGLAL